MIGIDQYFIAQKEPETSRAERFPATQHRMNQAALFLLIAIIHHVCELQSFMTARQLHHNRVEAAPLVNVKIADNANGKIFGKDCGEAAGEHRVAFDKGEMRWDAKMAWSACWPGSAPSEMPRSKRLRLAR